MDLNRENITLFLRDARWFQRIKINENLEKSLLQPEREIQPSGFPVIENSLERQNNIFNEESTIFFLSLPLLLLSVGLICQIGFRKFNKKQLSFFKHHPQIACRRCRFFHHSHYLKCAVNPDKVLTIAAKDCRDYQEK